MTNPFYLKLYKKNPSNDELIEIMRYFSALQQSSNYDGIDKILNEANMHRMESVIIISLLRCTNPIKKQLKFWDLFFKRAQVLIKDPDQIKLINNLL